MCARALASVDLLIISHFEFDWTRVHFISLPCSSRLTCMPSSSSSLLSFELTLTEHYSRTTLHIQKSSQRRRTINQSVNRRGQVSDGNGFSQAISMAQSWTMEVSQSNDFQHLWSAHVYVRITVTDRQAIRSRMKRQGLGDSIKKNETGDEGEEERSQLMMNNWIDWA